MAKNVLIILVFFFYLKVIVSVENGIPSVLDSERENHWKISLQVSSHLIDIHVECCASFQEKKASVLKGAICLRPFVHLLPYYLMFT